MIGADRFAAGTDKGGGTNSVPLGEEVAHGISVRLVDAGEQPLELLGALFQMGCPPELAYDYLEAAVLGKRPEVLVGAEASAATQLAEALRRSGATVAVEPPLEPSVEASLGPLPPPAEPLKAPVEPPVQAPEATIVLSDERQRSPSRPPDIDAVERYIAAYNDGNEAQLVGCLSPTAVLADATGRVLVEGADAIGRRMADVFAHYPDGRVTVIGRQIAGPWVLDHHSTTYGGGASEETVLCFRVDGALIDRLVLLTMT